MAKNEVVDDTPETIKKVMTAGEARLAILKASTPRVEYGELKGIPLELRQPTLSEFLSQNSVEGERDATKVTIQMLVKYTFLKGSDDRVFEPTDVDSLLSLPMSGEWLTLIQKMNELLDIKVDAEIKN